MLPHKQVADILKRSMCIPSINVTIIRRIKPITNKATVIKYGKFDLFLIIFTPIFMKYILS